MAASGALLTKQTVVAEPKVATDCPMAPTTGHMVRSLPRSAFACMEHRFVYICMHGRVGRCPSASPPSGCTLSAMSHARQHCVSTRISAAATTCRASTVDNQCLPHPLIQAEERVPMRWQSQRWCRPAEQRPSMPPLSLRASAHQLAGRKAWSWLLVGRPCGGS